MSPFRANDRDQPMRTADAVAVAQEVATLEDASLPLPSGLRALADEAPNPRLARSLRQLAVDIEAGRSLDDALAAPGLALPKSVRAMLEAGRRSNHGVSLLARTLGDASLAADLKRRIQLGLIYPALLTGAAILLMMALFGLILSNFHDIYQEIGGSPNWFSDELLRLGERLSKVNFWFLLAIPASLLILAVLHRLLFTPAERRRLTLAMPIFGPIFRYAALTNFCRVLSDLLDARLPLPEAIELAGESVNDPVVGEFCREAAAKVTAGADLNSLLAGETLFPEGFSTFLTWARKVPEPSQALRLAANIFEARAQTQARFATSFLKLLAIVLVIWLVLTAFAVIVFPLVRFLTSLAL